MAQEYKIPESVLVVIYTAALEVLIIKRIHSDYWQSVTGSKDTPDEVPLETARREVMEETGIVVGQAHATHTLQAGSIPSHHLSDWQLTNIYDIYPEWRHRYAPGVVKNTEHVFGLLVPHKMTVTLSAHEHTDYCWLPYKEAADRCFSPSNAEAILQLPYCAKR